MNGHPSRTVRTHGTAGRAGEQTGGERETVLGLKSRLMSSAGANTAGARFLLAASRGTEIPLPILGRQQYALAPGWPDGTVLPIRPRESSPHDRGAPYQRHGLSRRSLTEIPQCTPVVTTPDVPHEHSTPPQAQPR